MAEEDINEHEYVIEQLQEHVQKQVYEQEHEQVNEEEHEQVHGQDLEQEQEHEQDEMPNNTEPPQSPLKQESYSELEVQEEKRWPGWPGDNIFRMLVPLQKVGSIIGRKGEFIKKITEETRARIKILDGPPGTTERAVMVSAKEEPDAAIPPAVDGLLSVHKRIVNLDDDPAHATSGAGGTVVTRLLLADTQARSLIGKQGSNIKSIQDASNCTVRVLGAEHLPSFALQDDNVVEIQGEPSSVHKAVELIATHLRKYLVDHSIVGVFEMQMQMSNARANQNMPPPPPHLWGPPPQGFMGNSGGRPGFGPSPPYMPPPAHHHDNHYPPVDLHPFEQQSRQPPPYGRDASVGGHSMSGPPPQAVITKVHNMQVPLLYADAVIGISGANISYIRRTSGATIAVQETRGVPGEMTVEIEGSASQIQTAQQLIQNFIAEASASASTQAPTGGPINQVQDYNSYPGHGPVYASPPSNAPGHAGHPHAGDYGSGYGTNYGY